MNADFDKWKSFLKKLKDFNNNIVMVEKDPNYVAAKEVPIKEVPTKEQPGKTPDKAPTKMPVKPIKTVPAVKSVTPVKTVPVKKQ